MKFTNKPMIIYFVHKDDEVVYIGQTSLTLEKRKSQHEYNASRGKGYIIGAAIRKHGAEKFTWNVHSMYYSQVDLDTAEKHYIAKYSPAYNIHLGGESRGKRKKSGKPAWNKGKKSPQVPWNKGRIETRLDVIENIKRGARSRSQPNRKIGDEQRSAMIEGRREARRKKNTPFLCYQNGKTYTLVVDAARDLGIDPNGIYQVLRGERLKSYKGFTFSYLQSVRAA